MQNGSKIVGGILAKQNSWPAQASIFLSNFGRSTFICGGTLIKRDMILTAAHCVNFVDASDLIIYLGVHNKSILNTNGVVKATVKKIIVV